ncbi:MAG: NAD(+)/NADH kinase [Myxococcales bacterium]
MRTIGLIPRLGKDDAAALARELSAWLSARGHQPLTEAESGIAGVPTAPGLELAARADLLVALGGDGTLIHAAGLCRGREVPILGVNLGTLGFLTEVPRDRARALLEQALAGALPVSRRLMLAAEVRREGQVLLEGTCLNDVVVSKNALSRLARLEACVGDKIAAVYEADGLIIASPTGSTAYSLSAGGPIVHPSVETMLLTPICPHSLTQRPLVLPADLPIRIRLASPSEMFVTLDGAVGRELREGDELLVRRASHRLLLLRNPEVDPFSILRGKLRWGQR